MQTGLDSIVQHFPEGITEPDSQLYDQAIKGAWVTPIDKVAKFLEAFFPTEARKYPDLKLHKGCLYIIVTTDSSNPGVGSSIIEQIVEPELSKYGCSEDVISRYAACVREGCMNGVEYGNRVAKPNRCKDRNTCMPEMIEENKKKPLYVETVAMRGPVLGRVTDRGPGFPEALYRQKVAKFKEEMQDPKDPLDMAFLMQPHGRGFWIIDQYSDREPVLVNEHLFGFSFIVEPRPTS